MEYPATTATVETLPNGLTLILDPDPTAPVVSAQIWVETGSIHEDENLGAGISHFLEHDLTGCGCSVHQDGTASQERVFQYTYYSCVCPQRGPRSIERLIRKLLYRYLVKYLRKQ